MAVMRGARLLSKNAWAAASPSVSELAAVREPARASPLSQPEHQRWSPLFGHKSRASDGSFQEHAQPVACRLPRTAMRRDMLKSADLTESSSAVLSYCPKCGHVVTGAARR